MFFGTTTVGERGQVVIPSEAREAMGIEKGEKLLVFGIGKEMIAFSKLEHIEKITSELSKKLETLKDAVKKTK